MTTETETEPTICTHCGSPSDAPDPTCSYCPETDRVACYVGTSCTYIAADDDELAEHKRIAHPNLWECNFCGDEEDTDMCGCGQPRPVVTVVTLRIVHDPSNDPREWDWSAELPGAYTEAAIVDPRTIDAEGNPVPCMFRASLVNGNHSDDRVVVFHGHTEPAILCGFHASEEWSADALAYVTNARKAGLL